MTIQINHTTTLKHFELSDSEALFSLVDENRNYLKQWLPWLDFNKSSSDSQKFIDASIIDATESIAFVYGIWHETVLSGVASLQNISKMNRSANIGYWVGEKFSGMGLGKLATQSLVDHAFANLALNRIEIRCATGNLKSQNIPQKLGFSFEGIAQQSEWLYDRFVDHHVYAMLAKNWRKT